MSSIIFHNDSPYILEFEIKGLPKSTNSFARVGWQARFAYSRKWKTWVKAVAVQKVPSSPLKTAKLTLTRHSSKEPDFDGLVSCFKCILDALVEVGILENDKQSNIGQPTYLWQKTKMRQGKITIRVEEK